MKAIDKTILKLKYPPMVVIGDKRKDTGWITAIICGRWVQAKVYDEPSEYGIDNGRVSKLAIMKTDTRDVNSAYHPQLCYHWDRGLDFKRKGTTIAFVREIVAILEELPITAEEE